MKVFRKIGISLLTIFLTDLFILFILSYTIPDVLINDLILGNVSSFVSDMGEGDVLSEIIESSPNPEVLKEMLESDEMKGLVGEFMDQVLDELIDDDQSDFSSLELENEMIDYLMENREKIEEKSGISITDEMIDEVRSNFNHNDIDPIINQTIDNTKKSMPKEATLVLKWYKIVTSLKFRLFLLFLMFLDVFLIALIQFSFYRFIYNVSYAMILSGISVLLLGFGSRYILAYTMILSNFNPSSIIHVGFIVFFFGVVMRIFYGIFMKRRGERVKDAVS